MSTPNVSKLQQELAKLKLSHAALLKVIQASCDYCDFCHEEMARVLNSSHVEQYSSSEAAALKDPETA